MCDQLPTQTVLTMFLTRSSEALFAFSTFFAGGGGFVLSLFLPFLCRFLESLFVVVVECGESFKVTDGWERERCLEGY